MASVEINGLEAVAGRLDKLPDAIRDKIAGALSDAGADLLRSVQRNIGGTGTISSVQDVYMGSGRGYVAVRPMADVYIDMIYAAGYVTNALEGGHKTPKGRGRVPGKYMYANASTEATNKAEQIIDQINQVVKEHMEG